MRINSVSQLDQKTITIPELIQTESYIEMSFLSGIVDDELSLYNSYKLPFHEYNSQISDIVESIKDYIDEKVNALCAYIDKLSDDLNDRLDAQDERISNFIYEADNEWFVHKTQAWTQPEDIYGTKIFVDVVGVDGPNSMLSAENVIEGTSRRALWG